MKTKYVKIVLLIGAMAIVNINQNDVDVLLNITGELTLLKWHESVIS